MALLPEQQAVELIGRSKNILLTTREHASMDAISSAIAIGLVLKKLNKTFDVAIPGFEAKDLPSFLPKGVEIRSTVGAMRSFHLSVDVAKTPLSELMYDVKDGKLNITIVPKQGEWSEADVNCAPVLIAMIL
jgi:nanoRNase/pAp phosphatase (c-di-AMP/oligoRNAs hydrolase)